MRQGKTRSKSRTRRQADTFSNVSENSFPKGVSKQSKRRKRRERRVDEVDDLSACRRRDDSAWIRAFEFSSNVPWSRQEEELRRFGSTDEDGDYGLLA